MQSQPAGPTPPQATPPDARIASDERAMAMLREVHEAVVARKASGGSQLLTAIILSLATLASTWCGYQASRWGGVQSSMQATADTAERHTAENTLAGLQIRTQDGLVILEYWRALRAGDEKATATLLPRMRPELRRALDASIRQGILTDPSVPGPLHQPEYVLEYDRVADARRKEATEAQRRADAAGDVSSEYVLVTLMLASVLFAGGVATTFQRRSIRRTLAVIALLVMAIAALQMARLPLLWPLTSADAPVPTTLPA